MEDLSHFYQILGLKDGASAEDVKQAYRDLVKVWHPDRFSHDERLRLIAQDKLKEINSAYEVLQAHFFEASIAPETTSLPEPEAAAEAATPARPPSSRNRMALWVTLGVLVIVAAVALLFLNKGRGKQLTPASTSKPDQTTHRPDAGTRYALSFDGNQCRVAIATTGSLTGTFTVECWALTRRPKGTETILGSRAPKDFSFNIKFRQGKRFHGDIGDGSRWLARMANAPFNYNRDIWYHLAYVVTPTNYTIYINGDSRGADSIYPPGNPMLYDPAHQLCLGADGLDPEDLDGSVAEVRIWKTARTAQQIKANMSAPLAGNEPGLQGYWRFDEGAGKTALDSSGHGFTGKLVGNVSWTTNAPPLARR